MCYYELAKSERSNTFLEPLRYEGDRYLHFVNMHFMKECAEKVLIMLQEAKSWDFSKDVKVIHQEASLPNDLDELAKEF